MSTWDRRPAAPDEGDLVGPCRHADATEADDFCPDCGSVLREAPAETRLQRLGRRMAEAVIEEGGPRNFSSGDSHRRSDPAR